MLNREIEARIAFHVFGYSLFEYVNPQEDAPKFVLAYPSPFFQDEKVFKPAHNTWVGAEATDIGCAPGYLRPEHLDALLDKLFTRQQYHSVTRTEAGVWVVTYSVPGSRFQRYATDKSLSCAVAWALLDRHGIASKELLRIFDATLGT